MRREELRCQRTWKARSTKKQAQSASPTLIVGIGIIGDFGVNKSHVVPNLAVWLRNGRKKGDGRRAFVVSWAASHKCGGGRQAFDGVYNSSTHMTGGLAGTSKGEPKRLRNMTMVINTSKLESLAVQADLSSIDSIQCEKLMETCSGKCKCISILVQNSLC